MLREGLRQKRITWPLIMNNSLIIKLTHASMPTYMLKMVCGVPVPFNSPTVTDPYFTRPSQILKEWIEAPIKFNAVAKCEIATEHFWRVRTAIGGPAYDREVRAMLNKNNIRIPFGCAGHDVDDLRYA